MKQNDFDAYDISKQIFDLWQTHTNRMSGQLNKKCMTVPISVFTGNTYALVTGVSFDEKQGIIINIRE